MGMSLWEVSIYVYVYGQSMFRNFDRTDMSTHSDRWLSATTMGLLSSSVNKIGGSVRFYHTHAVSVLFRSECIVKKICVCVYVCVFITDQVSVLT